jgi:cobyrinic acid a,c-diamide synthase
VQVKGHEFHYSHIEENDTPSVAQLYNARGGEVSTKLMRYKNVIAGYTHIYWPDIDLMKLFSPLNPPKGDFNTV